MRIGILTFWWSQDNYGQILQCYALQKFLRDAGHDAFLIRYDHTHDYMQNPFRRMLKGLNPVLLINYLLEKRHRKEVALEQKKNDRQFDLFRDKYICKTDKVWHSYNDLKLTYPEADCYIVGSDQVWNYWFVNIKRYNNPFHAYFLDFGSESIKRLSYAASWGVMELPEDYKQMVKPLLAKFNYVGVREQSGVELCKQCGCDYAECVCDPTLLLDAESYRKIYKENEVRKPSCKYIMLYMLNNICDFDIQHVYDFAAEKELEVVYVTGNDKIDNRKKYFATIPEWLYLVDNAEYVITNSFHCGVFSIIFHKQFGIVPLAGKHAIINTRFESLYSLFEIRKRYIRKDDFSILNEQYDNKTISISQKFKSYLK